MKVKKENIYYAYLNQKRVGVAILIAEKLYIDKKLLLETKKYIIIKWSIYEE